MKQNLEVLYSIAFVISDEDQFSGVKELIISFSI